MDVLVEKLKDLGFNSYEAKVYLALLKKHPASGYEVAQIAGIPQSKAYDTLKSLVKKNILTSTNDKPQKYSPISPKELTKRLSRKYNSSINYLGKNLPDVSLDYNDPVLQIFGYEKIIEKLKEIIKSSKSSIYLEIWNEDFKKIEKEIKTAYDNDVDIKIVGYDNISSVYGLIYSHEGAREIESMTGSRMVYLLSDFEEAVFGKIQSHVCWTKNEEVTFLLKEFIVHDMYLLDVQANFPEQLKYFYGSGFRKLKDKILVKNSGNIH